MSINARRDPCPHCGVEGWGNHGIDCPYYAMYPDKAEAFKGLLGDYRELQARMKIEQGDLEQALERAVA